MMENLFIYIPTRLLTRKFTNSLGLVYLPSTFTYIQAYNRDIIHIGQTETISESIRIRSQAAVEVNFTTFKTLMVMHLTMSSEEFNKYLRDTY